MRILLVHNYYQSSAPSGEDSVFATEKLLLERAGHEVLTYERHNDDISESIAARLHVGLAATWSSKSYREVTQLIIRHKPDLAHFHNTFPLISPSAYRACKVQGVPVVQTLHNYRLICPGALLLRDGKPCEDCVGGSLLPAIRHGCYRGSKLASGIVATMLQTHRVRNTYRSDVDRYIALTEFARQRFVRGGLPAERITVRPNCLMDPPSPGDGSGRYALYVGRLTGEKGIETLVRAWSNIDLQLLVVGDGALRKTLEQRSLQSASNISFVGLRTRQEVWSLMQDASMLIIPSECYEGFPMTVLESLATGTPIVASSLGALDEILSAPSNCLKFTAGNIESLRDAVIKLHADTALRASMRVNNRRLFDEKFSPESSLNSLLDIYRALAIRDRCAEAS